MREVLGLLHVLRREQHGRAAGDEILDEAPDIVAGPGVQAGGRLVEEQHPRAADQAGADVEAAAHAARVGLHELIGRVGEREAFEHLLGAAAALGLAQLVEEPDELEVLASGEQFVDGGELSGEADQRAQFRGVGDDVAAGHDGAAAVGSHERRQDAHERCLAGPVGAEQREHLALLGDEVEVGERLCGAEGLIDSLDFDHRHGWPLSIRLTRSRACRSWFARHPRPPGRVGRPALDTRRRVRQRR